MIDFSSLLGLESPGQNKWKQDPALIQPVTFDKECHLILVPLSPGRESRIRPQGNPGRSRTGPHRKRPFQGRLGKLSIYPHFGHSSGGL
jgi:hypothetical protein